MQTLGEKCKYFNIVLCIKCVCVRERVRNECVIVITEKMLTHTNKSKRKIFYYMKNEAVSHQHLHHTQFSDFFSSA